MIKTRDEYRVTKKGSECFRAGTYEEAKRKLDQLTGGKPNAKYGIQVRSCRYEGRALATDHLGRPEWTPWRELR